MSSVSYLATTLGLLTLGVRKVLSQDTSLPVCVAYGMDFQNGGSYFQNILSPENFGFVSQYEGMCILLIIMVMLDTNSSEVAKTISHITFLLTPLVIKRCVRTPSCNPITQTSYPLGIYTAIRCTLELTNLK
jgi:hypothetical protein